MFSLATRNAEKASLRRDRVRHLLLEELDVLLVRGRCSMRMPGRFRVFAILWAFFGCALSSTAAPAAAASGCSRTLVAAGDMNKVKDARATGALAVALHPGLVATLGDHIYPAATLRALQGRYDRSPWGHLKPRDHPVPGHHEYRVPGAQGYFAYFGVPSHYSYDIGCGWRGYALDSLAAVAPQAAWLRRDLAAHPGARVLATWSDPRFSSGVEHGSEPAMQPFFSALAGRRAVVLSGHEHDYERFAPVAGVRSFVVGTAGSASYPFGTPLPGSQVRITGVPGVLLLRLDRSGYRWQFKDVDGVDRDAGSG
jgi:hypothetical protein